MPSMTLEERMRQDQRFFTNQSLDTVSFPGTVGGPFNQGNTSQVWPSANLIIYCPLRVPVRIPVKKLWAHVTATGTGNVDIGIYSRAGARLVNTGTTAHGTTDTALIVDVSGSAVVLRPGLYYYALQGSNGTDTFRMYTITAPALAAFGYRSEAAGGFGLPATATWTVPQTLAAMPIGGVLVTTTIS